MKFYIDFIKFQIQEKMREKRITKFYLGRLGLSIKISQFSILLTPHPYPLVTGLHKHIFQKQSATLEIIFQSIFLNVNQTV